MIRIPVLSLIATLITTQVEAKPCTLRNNFCVPFVACTQDGAEFFFGRSFGRRSGPVEAQSASGIKCTGTWKRTAIGAGRTNFQCSDGQSGRGTFTYFDSTTGTATGRGRTKSGDRLRFWAGPDILRYILNGSEDDLELITCVQRAMDQAK